LISSDPRLPYLPTGKDEDPVTLGFMRRVYERFYQLWGQAAPEMSAADPLPWTIGITFATPGDVADTPGTSFAEYVRDGSTIHATFVYSGTITHTTAAGNLQMTGLPFAATAVSLYQGAGSLSWGGITKAGYTFVMPRIAASDTAITFVGSGSGVARSFITAADVPTGGTLQLIGRLTYRAD
jgi:hypothetical protein